VETSLLRITRNTSPGSRFRDKAAGLRDTRLDARDLTIKLLLVNELENFADPRPGRQSQREQMAPEQQRRGRMMLDAERARTFEEPVHRSAVEVAGTAETVGARHACE